MKVNNTNIYMGDSVSVKRQQQEASTKADSGSGKSFFGGGLTLNQDKYLLQKSNAQKKAMKVMGDARSNQLTLDDEVKQRKQQIRELMKD